MGVFECLGDIGWLAELLDEMADQLFVVRIAVDQLEGADVLVLEKDRQQTRGKTVEGADLGGTNIVSEGRFLVPADPFVFVEYGLYVLAGEPGVYLLHVQLDLVLTQQP